MFVVKKNNNNFVLSALGEEGGSVQEAHDGKASGLCCSLCHLSRHVHRNQRDRNTHGKKSITNETIHLV